MVVLIAFSLLSQNDSCKLETKVIMAINKKNQQKFIAGYYKPLIVWTV